MLFNMDTTPEEQGSIRHVDISKFAITRNAFLPEESPPLRLSDPYYAPWETILRQLSTLIKSEKVHQAVAQLPLLSTDRLQSEPEWRRAYVMLAYLASAHTWSGLQPEQILPPQITVPYLEAARHVEMPPTISYTATNLWNFCSVGTNFSVLADLKVLFSFTGTEDESWFLLISVAMEAQAAGIIEIMLAALAAVKIRDYPVIIGGVQKLRQCINNVSDLLMRMYEKCDPMVFYHRIRPFLAGSKNMEHAGLPQGVFYDEGDGNGEWRQLRGGSNGQSSLIQFFDIVLGVEHHDHGSAGQKSFHDEVRDYMPGPHRRFLQHIQNMASIRELVLEESETREHQRLRAEYKAAIEALASFRDKHIQIVTRYIILPSRKAPKSDARKNLASSSSERNGDTDLTGTGGTTLVPFLRTSRNETSDAGKLSQENV